MTKTFAAPKVPEVFLLFWVVKLLTTAIGESGADWMGHTSLVLAGVVGVGGFAAALVWQLRSDAYHPIRYWITVLTVALFGTMIADGPHEALGFPYWVDSVIYFVMLIGLLAWWKTSEGTFSVHSIHTPRRERFYWGTVLLTFGLGTALGDTTASTLHMGFVWSIALFAVLILIPWAAFKLGASAVITFWISYALTRPLGASVADELSYKGPFGGFGNGPVTLVGLVAFIAFVAYLTRTHHDVEGHHDVAHSPAAGQGVLNRA